MSAAMWSFNCVWVNVSSKSALRANAAANSASVGAVEFAHGLAGGGEAGLLAEVVGVALLAGFLDAVSAAGFNALAFGAAQSIGIAFAAVSGAAVASALFAGAGGEAAFALVADFFFGAASA